MTASLFCTQPFIFNSRRWRTNCGRIYTFKEVLRITIVTAHAQLPHWKTPITLSNSANPPAPSAIIFIFTHAITLHIMLEINIANNSHYHGSECACVHIILLAIESQQMNSSHPHTHTHIYRHTNCMSTIYPSLHVYAWQQGLTTSLQELHNFYYGNCYLDIQFHLLCHLHWNQKDMNK